MKLKHIHWSRPGTVWTFGVTTKTKCRQDVLFGFVRFYSRKYRSYLWAFYCWRLCIIWWLRGA